jgi:hypothetical protein
MLDPRRLLSKTGSGADPEHSDSIPIRS